MKRGLILLCVIGVVSRFAPLSGQAIDRQWISVLVGVLKTAPLKESPYGVRVYNEPVLLPVRVVITNETASSELEVIPRTLQAAVSVRVSKDGVDVPVIVTWVEEADTVWGARPSFRSLDVPLLLAPGQSGGWTLNVQQVEGEKWSNGEYVLEVRAPAARSAIAVLGGSPPWAGEVPDRLGRLRVLVRPPTSAEEKAHSHQLNGDYFNARGEPADALREYEQQLESRPGDRGVSEMIGLTRMQMGQFREATLALEMAYAGMSGGRHQLMILATAYAAVGDVANASRVLRAYGLQESQLGPEIERARRRARDYVLPR